MDAATSIPESLSLKEGDPAYGYLWWLLPDSHRADGRDGQMIHVFPERDMVVVHTGAGGTKMNIYDREGNFYTPRIVKECLIPYIIQAAESEAPLPANDPGVALLESKIQQAGAQPEAKPVPPLPNTARTVSGKTYAMDPNRLGITGVSLTFQDEKEALLRLSAGEMGQLEILVGLDDVDRFSPAFSFRGVPALVAAKGAWESDNTFVIDWDEIGNVNRIRIEATFEGDEATFEGDETTLQIEAPLYDVSVIINGKQIVE